MSIIAPPTMPRPNTGSFLDRGCQRLLENPSLAKEYELLRRGYPTTKDEAWHFTDLKVLSNYDFGSPSNHTDNSQIRLFLDKIYREMGLPTSFSKLIFVNGRFCKFLSVIRGHVYVRLFDGTPSSISSWNAPGDEFVVSMNKLLANEGTLIKVRAGHHEECIIVHLNVGQKEIVSSHLFHHVTLDKGAELTLIEISTGDGLYLSNPVMICDIGEYARLDHLKIEDEDTQSFHLSSHKISVFHHAHYEGFQLVQGGKLVRQNFSLDLNGSSSKANLNIVQMLSKNQHADTSINACHLAPNCLSRQMFRSVLSEQSRGVFQGKTFVSHEAQKTDSYQLAQGLLLSDKAEMDSRPELEIYADDVRCGHGATSGTLDESQLFYLQSRGISLSDAKSMLVNAFLVDSFHFIEKKVLHEIALKMVSSRWKIGVS